MPGIARGLQDPAAVTWLAIFLIGLFVCMPYWMISILNILALDGYHRRITEESRQTFGSPMTPRTLVSMCHDGGENSPGLFSWWKMLHMLFAFLLVYNLHKVPKSEAYSSLNFYICIPMYPPSRSRHRTLILNVCKSTMIQSHEFI